MDDWMGGMDGRMETSDRRLRERGMAGVKGMLDGAASTCGWGSTLHRGRNLGRSLEAQEALALGAGAALQSIQ